MDDGNRKPANDPPDADALEKLLELELVQKRASWERDKQRLGMFRALAFLFLALVVIGALGGFFFFFSTGQMSDGKGRSAPQLETPSPTASPR